MSEKPVDLTTEVLIRIREELSALRGDVAELRSEMNARFDEAGRVARTLRRDHAGMLVMMRATAGDFDQRVGEVEERVRALEAGRA
jgi:hypothetical protein